MTQPLDYEVPTQPQRSASSAGVWAIFFLAGVLGVPFARWVVESWYYVQHSDGTILIVELVFLIPLALLLSLIRWRVPRIRFSMLLPIVLGFFGPLAMTVICAYIFHW